MDRNYATMTVTAFFASLVLALTGCDDSSKKAQVQHQQGLSTCSVENGFYSGKAQLAHEDLFMIQLSEPPLLSSVRLDRNGKRVIPQSAIEAIEEEQAEFLDLIEDLYPSLTVVYSYKMVLNGISVYGPSDDISELSELSEVSLIARSEPFARPTALNETTSEDGKPTFKGMTSVEFINALQAHKETVASADGTQTPLKGKGIRVGIIDTGIDYTHEMLGGPGTTELFESIKPHEEAPKNLFPNAKVVGGYDFAGSEFNTSRPHRNHIIPVPDTNPIDEAGHGTHVAGTVAGIGDGFNTYSGVAPEASLYALKVFGQDGSTTDSVVIKSLDYAADPNGDYSLDDQLHVVNLSLGGGYGQPHSLYNEAITNLSKAGTLVVASAGNASAVDNIVGAPSTANDALSVAASIDGMVHNWRFAASNIDLKDGKENLVAVTEGPITKPVAETDVSGPLVPVGLANDPLSDDLKAKLNGKIALAYRGEAAFVQKIQNCIDAGAIGVVMVNNTPEPPISMGGELPKPFPIPAIMITQALGQKIEKLTEEGTEVTITFNSGKFIEKSELIDTLTGFSSKGPRMQDSAIKPEITAPGEQIVSASMGTGNKGVRLNGTSMSGPHMAGVVALLKQRHPNLSYKHIRSLAINNTVLLKKLLSKETEMVSRQGGGRIDTLKAVTANTIAQPAVLSLGEVAITDLKPLNKKLTLTNIDSSANLNLTIEFQGHSNLEYVGPKFITLLPNQSRVIEAKFDISPNKLSEQPIVEMDGYLKVMGGTTDLNIPVLAVAQNATRINLTKSELKRNKTYLTFKNSSPNEGPVYLYNLIGRDETKITSAHAGSINRSTSCDLESAGYKIIEKEYEFEEGKKETIKVLQVAFKVYTPMTNWNTCHATLLIDENGDGKADFELLGSVPGASLGLPPLQLSYLLNAHVARNIRFDYDKRVQQIEKGAALPENFSELLGINYTPSLIAALPFQAQPHGTLAIVEAPLASLPKGDRLRVLPATMDYQGYGVQFEDFLNGTENDWKTISLKQNLKTKEFINLEGHSETRIKTQVSNPDQELIAYFPFNEPSLTNRVRSRQSKVIDLTPHSSNSANRNCR